MNQDIHWGWEPLPGYTNPDTPLVAMSHMGPNEDDPDYIHTWPSSWPDKTSDPIDPGWSEAGMDTLEKSKKMLNKNLTLLWMIIMMLNSIIFLTH